MRKLILISCFALSVLSFAAEAKLPEAVDEKPELAPICPEGFYWVDSIKSCTLILDE